MYKHRLQQQLTLGNTYALCLTTLQQIRYYVKCKYYVILKFCCRTTLWNNEVKNTVLELHVVKVELNGCQS